jgi:hypothetical protein
MDTLKNSQNSLLYFSNENETIGITIQKGNVTISNKDYNDSKILANFNNKYDTEIFKEFHGLNNKLCIKYKIKSKSGCFSKTTDKFIAFITYNNEQEHKATYKLTVYSIRQIGVYTNDYDYYNTYYSYFA